MDNDTKSPNITNSGESIELPIYFYNKESLIKDEEDIELLEEMSQEKNQYTFGSMKIKNNNDSYEVIIIPEDSPENGKILY